MEKAKKIFINLILIILGCFLLLWPALINGYPLVYSDTGTYIAAGFQSFVPVDRPIIYSLFVQYISMGNSLWFIVISQALILIFTLFTLFELFFKKHVLVLVTGVIFILSISTGIANYTSQIMPDIFSAITILCAGVILTRKGFHFYDIILYPLLIFSATTHLSNLMVLLGMLLITFILLVFKVVNRTKFSRVILLAVLPFIFILGINKQYSGRFILSRASNSFIFSRMLETGVPQDFLEKNCENNEYIFCNNYQQLPRESYKFLWENSPLYDEECRAISWDYCWEEKDHKIGALNKAILASSSHRNILLRNYASGFFEQLITFDIGVLIPMKEGSPPYRLIDEQFNSELKDYVTAKQFTKDFKNPIISAIQRIFVFISLALTLLYFLFFKWVNIPTNFSRISFYLFLGLVGNALTTTLFSTVLDRYQSRIVWIIPLLFLLLIAQLSFSKPE